MELAQRLDLSSVSRKRPSIVERAPSQLSFAASRESLRSSISHAEYASEASSQQTVRQDSSEEPRQEQQQQQQQEEDDDDAYRSREHQQSEATIAVQPQPHPQPHPQPARAAAHPKSAMKPVSAIRRSRGYDSPPTPNVDDTPYIRYALDQLTREEPGQRASTPTSEASYPVHRLVPDHGLGYVQSIKKVRAPAVIDIAPTSRIDPTASPHAADRLSERTSTASTAKPDMYIPIPAPRNSPRYPDLTYKPTILRPFSVTILMTLCLLMIAALMTCAIYSTKNDGLTTYSDGLYNGRYFVFAFLPQLLAATIFLYAQSVMAGLTRIMPFAMMAGTSSTGRAEALFTRLYPSHWLPRTDLIRNGEAAVGISTLLCWPLLFSIPLQSALFSVLPHDGAFRWATVQGVAWTLVAIYILAVAGLLTMTLSLWRRTTGLIWDPTSLADIISLLPRSNNLHDFNDTEVLATLEEIRSALPQRVDRLGYWRSTAPSTGPLLFHGIGEEGCPTRRYTLQGGKTSRSLRKSSFDAITKHLSLPLSPIGGKAIPHHGTNSSLMAKVYSPAIRFRHVPGLLTDANLVFYPAAFFILYIVMLAFSFYPGTAISKGFAPLVPSASNSAAFSPANFLFSFVPSLLGMLLYLGLISLAQHICILTPWASMNSTSASTSGATPQRSILLSYAYSISVPFATVLPSIRNRHYLVTLLAVATPLALLIPILAGGFLFPLLALPSQTLLIFPVLSAYYTMLVLLGLILLLLTLIPLLLMRRQTRLSYRLPHSVNHLASILTFLYASQILNDATFQNVQDHADLTTRLLTSSGTMASSEKRRSTLTGDSRGPNAAPQRAAQAAPPQRDDARGTWDASKWGGVGGWARSPAPGAAAARTSETSQGRQPHHSFQSALSRTTDAPRYSTEAGDWSAWDKEMGGTGLGSMIVSGSRTQRAARPADDDDSIQPSPSPSLPSQPAEQQQHDLHAAPTKASARALLGGRGLSACPGGGCAKRYFLGIFRGVDGRSHFGIERVGREEGRGARDAAVAGTGALGWGGAAGANQSRFSL